MNIIKNPINFKTVIIDEKEVLIPEDWNIYLSKNILSYNTGFTPNTRNNDYYNNGSDVWVNISDMKQKIIMDSHKKINGSFFPKKKKTKKGNLLFSFKLTVGKIAFAGQDLYTNEAIWSFNEKCQIQLSYLYYYLPFCFYDNKHKNIYGAETLNQDILDNKYFILPTSKEERDVIANYLDNIEEELENMKTLRDNYENKLKWSINALLTGEYVVKM